MLKGALRFEILSMNLEGVFVGGYGRRNSSLFKFTKTLSKDISCQFVYMGLLFLARGALN
jgi:hypothetical protein